MGGGVLVVTNGGLVSQPNIPKKQKDRLEAVLRAFKPYMDKYTLLA